jgi:hypothetical protein
MLRNILARTECAIALIVLPICIVSTVVSERFDRRSIPSSPASGREGPGGRKIVKSQEKT